jgi:hypothetical protein
MPRDQSQWSQNLAKKAQLSGAKTLPAPRQVINPMHEIEFMDASGNQANQRNDDSNPANQKLELTPHKKYLPSINHLKYWRKSPKLNVEEAMTQHAPPHKIIRSESLKATNRLAPLYPQGSREPLFSELRDSDQRSRRTEGKITSLAQIASNISVRNAERFDFPTKRGSFAAAESKKMKHKLRAWQTAGGNEKNRASQQDGFFMTNVMMEDDSIAKDLVLISIGLFHGF